MLRKHNCSKKALLCVYFCSFCNFIQLPKPYERNRREVDLKVPVETSVLLKPLSHDRDFSLNSLSSHQSEKSIFCYFCNIISFNSLIFLDFFYSSLPFMCTELTAFGRKNEDGFVISCNKPVLKLQSQFLILFTYLRN